MSVLRKLKAVLVIILICSLTAGCYNSGVAAMKEGTGKGEGGQSGWYKSEEFSNALKLFDKYMEENPGLCGAAKTDTLQLVKMDRISERYYLISYMISPLYSLINYHYALVDLEKGSCEPINLDTIDYISEVTYTGDIITFHCEGNNVVNGFRDFPHVLKYDIEKRELITEYPYKSLKRGEYEILLGNGINKVGLSNVIENNKTIKFDFTDVKDTIHAGGWFCPRIRTGLKLDFKDTKTYYVDFEALVLSREAEKQIEDLEKLDYIEDVRIRSYKDVHEISHVAVYFRFKDVAEYACSFEDDSSNDFRDFIVTLR